MFILACKMEPVTSSIETRDTIDSRMDLFRGNVKDHSIVSERYLEFRNKSAVQRNQTIDIFVEKTNQYYIDFSRSYLKVTAKITKEKGGALVPPPTPAPANESHEQLATDPAPQDKVAFINNACISIFSSLHMQVGNTDFARNCSSLLPWKAMIDNLTQRSSEYLNSAATSSLFHWDTSKSMDVSN